MCFSLDFIKNVLILCVVIGFIFLCLKILIPIVLAQMGWTIPAWLIQIIRAFIGALLLILCIIIVFELISCLLSFTGFRFPSLRG